MRGQAERVNCQIVIQRITPADAGTSEHISVGDHLERDHPRGCGDKAAR